jgi:lysophospholipid acyltransferase (LPLAT)-like uncharacterized protein
VGTRKGGATALQSLIKAVRRGHPGILAVDGPRGPRGIVHPGIGMLAKKSGAAVIAVSVVPRRRRILSRTWDRLQIPMPFCRVDVRFGRPLRLLPDEPLDAFVARVEASLQQLDATCDPDEASWNLQAAGVGSDRGDAAGRRDRSAVAA